VLFAEAGWDVVVSASESVFPENHPKSHSIHTTHASAAGAISHQRKRRRRAGTATAT
jgi:hypothetical protein